MSMKIEIELDVDPLKWRHVGVRPPKKGERYYNIADKEVRVAAHNFELPQIILDPIPDWREGIKWPSVFREGTWVARDEDETIWIHECEPTPSSSECTNRGWFVRIGPLALDLSFLPDQFWTVDWTESACEVKHES